MRYKTLLTAFAVSASLAVLAPAAWARDYLTDAKQMMEKGDLRAAQIQLRNAVRSDPQSAEARFRLAQVHLALGDPAAAEKEAKAARDLGYDPRQAVPLLARTYMAQGKAAAVLQDFKVSGKDLASDVPTLIARGYALLEQRKPDEAREAFSQAEKLAPNELEPALALARAALVRGDQAAAEEKLARALAIDPKSADAFMLKAQVLRVKRDVPGAVAALDDAVKANPGALSARLERATLLLGSGQDEKAKADVDAVLAALPNNVQALLLQATLKARAKDFAGADAILQKIAPAMPQLPRAFLLQALVKDSLGQMEQAIDAASKYVSRVGDDPEGLRVLATLQLRAGQPGGVIETLKGAADAGKADAGMYDLLGRAYSATGRPDLAIGALSKAAELAPQDPGIWARLGATRMAANDPQGAAQDFGKAMALAPKDPTVAEGLFSAEIAAGRIDRAAASLEQIARAQGDTPVVGNLKGLLLLAKLDYADAAKELSRVVERSPDFLPAKINLARVALMQGRTEEANSILSEILEKNPTSEPALSQRVATLLRVGKVQEAAMLLQKAHAAAPDDVRMTARLAEFYLQTNETKKALDLVADVKPGTSGDAQLLAIRAAAQSVLKDWSAARDTYVRLFEVAPNAPELRRRYAAVLLELGDTEQARSQIQQALRSDPRNYALLSDYIGIDYRAKGSAAALATADQLASQAQDFPQAKALRGDVYMLDKKYDDAISAYAAAQKPSPTVFVTLREAAALNAAGRREDGIKLLREWTVTHPQDIGVSDTLSSFEIQAGRYKEAAALLQKILEKQPNNGIAMNNLAWVYQQLGDPKARELAQRAYLLMPSPQTADTLGWILTTDGRASEGLGLLRQAGYEASNDPRIQYHLAVALKDTGQKDDAVKILTRIVTGDVKFDEKDKAKALLSDLTKKS